ncbi:MAG: phenylalanine--tRNA ligase subunit beta [Deltaproteobacteria bacterium]|nr:MAG: phenylalanine--tRNA ligase subunit beta [Deltaproteobacteria bacterium]
MPTIVVDPDDFQKLLGEKVQPERLERLLELVKGEFKGQDPDGGWKIELNDTNRPDLWSAEGIARQIRCTLGRRRDYPFFDGEEIGQIIVEPGLEQIRPYVGAFVATGVDVTETVLVQLIQTQEKLAENFGRRRLAVAIGVYNLAKITFPVHYRPQDPDRHSYTPLGEERPMTLRQILESHPKGIQYRHTLEGHDVVPLLVDDAGMTLSMPPIVNSRETGEVVPGDSELFIEATGTDVESVMLALNIMACDLADRGAHIKRVCTVYPRPTPMGSRVSLPARPENSIELSVEWFGRLLGVPVDAVEIADVLERYGCEVSISENTARVTPPPVRLDYLHPVDVVEDFAICRGYDSFEPAMPTEFSVGRFTPLAELEDRVRVLMVGLGYEEIVSNLLVARRQVADWMNLPDKKLVEVLNRMNENYAVLRDEVIPSLLQVESKSGNAAYPHRIFEVGEVASYDPGAPHGSRTELHLAAVVAHRQAALFEPHADLEFLAEQLGVRFELVERDHPSFLPGRCAELVLGGRVLGRIGELHPQVLSSWQIEVPASGFEINLTALQAHLSDAST